MIENESGQKTGQKRPWPKVKDGWNDMLFCWFSGKNDMSFHEERLLSSERK